MRSRRNRRSKPSDLELMLSVERTRRRNRSGARRKLDRQGVERDLWSAYVLDGPARDPAANEPPPEVA